MDLDPSDAKVVGELEITGFSSYLHSINDDNTLLIGVGQEATNAGQILGLSISLFDARNSSKPVLLHRKTVEEDLNAFSSSDATFDF